jgi:hypothetical protein
MADSYLGAIMSPAQGNRLPAGALFCVDNNCGPGKDGEPGTAYPGNDAYLTMLLEMAEADGADPCDPDTSRCLFAAAPDILGDAAATLRRSRYMLPLIREIAGLPAALVAQDGLEDLDVPWEDFDVLFLGGSTGWKLGPAAAALTAEAHHRGKLVHMGRVNTRQRLRYAAHIGCDSADGTGMTRAPDKNLTQMLGWLREIHGQLALFGAVA